jgi:hypothetical protein
MTTIHAGRPGNPDDPASDPDFDPNIEPSEPEPLPEPASPVPDKQPPEEPDVPQQYRWRAGLTIRGTTNSLGPFGNRAPRATSDG